MSAQTLLGFDYGTTKIGVAVGQSLTGSASPLATLKSHNGKPDWEAIAALIDEWKPQACVIGLPLHLDGREAPVTEKARKFGRQINGRFNLPVYEMDERLTTEAAKARHADARKAGGRGKGKKGDLDALAAQMILEDYLRGGF